MAEENTSPSVPGVAKEDPVDSTAVADRKYTPAARRKRRRNLVILVAALVVLVSGALLWRFLSSYESTDDAQADVHLYPVSARISGYVVGVNVNDNQWVEKGAVLVEIDPRYFRLTEVDTLLGDASSVSDACASRVLWDHR